ncbi:MAG: DUF5985 family protein [Pseudomonadota bacterium]
MINGFLLGVIVVAGLVAGAFFLKFWRQTKDQLFAGFAAAFILESLNRAAFLFVDQPNAENPALYVVRLLSYLLILAAIVRKNRA